MNKVRWMYHPAHENRLFAVDTLYKDVDWNDFRAVVCAFQRQLEYWYILPTIELKANGHFAFPVAASACLLADTMSQYESGSLESRGAIFKGFLEKHFSALGNPFSTPIKSNRGDLKNGADAIWSGLRCGILHEAHPALYVGIRAQEEILMYHPTGYATYADGTGDCPVVTIDPARFFDAIHARLDRFIIELTAPQKEFNELRENFKRKFEYSYGVGISIAL